MNPLLISGFGTNISVDKRRLIIQNKLDNQRYEYYPHQIKHDSVIVDGHTGSISFEAMRWLVKHNIPIAMLNWNGNLLSVTLPKETVSSKLRLRQYEIYQDEERRYGIAYPIVKEKVKHSISLLAVEHCDRYVVLYQPSHSLETYTTSMTIYYYQVVLYLVRIVFVPLIVQLVLNDQASLIYAYVSAES